jgi:uncharacterized protein YjbI with pentapeptide repeats
MRSQQIEQSQKRQSRRKISWKIVLLIIAVLVVLAVTTIGILSAQNRISSNWAIILSASVTIIGVVVAACLLFFLPDKSEQSRSGRSFFWITGSIIAFLVIFELLFVANQANWLVGVFADLNPTGAGFSNRTLWDWLQLLIVPTTLILGAMLFYVSKRLNHVIQIELDISKRLDYMLDHMKEDISQKPYQNYPKLTLDKQWDLLQVYLEYISDLLLEKGLRSSQPNPEVRSVARAKTLITLTQLDGSHKGTLLRFLNEVNLIGTRDNVIQLTGADLSGVILSGADLRDIDLKGTDLAGARLKGSRLSGANLENADLREANLSFAILTEAILIQADLLETNLRGANLISANLNGADLSSANLSYANLEGALVTTEQLTQAKSITGVTMPDGSKITLPPTL